MSPGPLRKVSNAIREPSGDHAGAPSVAGSSVSRSTFVPAAFMT
jgi:hypothetical protein